jgi:predicted amidohydrolase
MELLKVALVQSPLFWESPESNRAMLEEKLAGIEHTHLVILPEMFTTGFTMDTSLAEPHNFTTLKWMKLMAVRLNAAITGSFIVKDGGRVFNRLYFVTPDGTAAYYDKRHLFRMAGEDKKYNAGSKHLIVDYRGWRIAPFICYDLRFPVWSRNRDVEGNLTYDLALYVANWPQPRENAWSALLAARAMENSSYVCGVNRIGIDGANVEYSGKSMVCNPRGRQYFEPDSEDRIIHVELSIKELNDYRDKFPAHLDGDDFIIK